MLLQLLTEDILQPGMDGQFLNLSKAISRRQGVFLVKDSNIVVEMSIYTRHLLFLKRKEIGSNRLATYLDRPLCVTLKVVPVGL